MGHAILGGSLRAVGSPAQADDEYRVAYQFAAAGVSIDLRADLDSRLAILRACQGRLDEALSLAVESIGALRGEAYPELLAQALVVQGYILNKAERFRDAMPCFSEALNTSDQARSARVHHAATHNLAYSLLNTQTVSLSGMVNQIRAARRRLRPHRDGVPRHKYNWLEGLMWLRMGMHNRAIQAFGVAKRGFERLALPYEIALVSLDLAGAHYFCERFSDALRIAEEAFEYVEVLESDREPIAVLKLWLEAVRARTLTEEITAGTRDMIESRIGPHGYCRSRPRRAGPAQRYPS